MAETRQENEEALIADLAMKVAGEIGGILSSYAGVVRCAKRVVRLRYKSGESWESLSEAIGELAGELEKATGTKYTSW